LINSIIKETGKDTLKYIPAKVGPAIVNFVGLLIFTHIFSAEDYGNYFILMTTITIMNIASSNWLTNSILRFYAKCKLDNKLNEFFSTVACSFVVCSITIVALYLSGFFIFRSYLPKQLVPFLRIGIFSYLALSTYLVLLFVLRASLKAAAFSGFEIISSIGKFLVALIFIFFFKQGAISLLWGILIVNLTLAFVISRRLSLFKYLKVNLFSPSISLDFLKYGFPLTFSSLSAWLLTQSDRYLLGYFKTAKDVGMYSVSFSVADRSLSLLYSILMLAAYPIMVQTWEEKGKEVTQKLIGELSRYFFILCVPVFVGISILSKDIFTLLIGKNFHEGFGLVPLFAFCSVAQGLFQYVGKSFELSKRTFLLAIAFFIAGLANVLLNILIIPSYGYMGAGIVKVISYAILLILGMSLAYSFMPWLAPLKSLAKIVLSAALMGVALVFIKKVLATSVPSLIFLITAGAFIYFILLLLFKEIKKKEIDFVKSYYYKLTQSKSRLKNNE